MKKAVLGLALLLLSGFASAAPLEVVSVQLPAWVQRGSENKPLTPGLELKADDVVRTGAGARVQLLVEEGSTIKLGENANLRIGAMGTAAEDKSLFKAALQLAQGAFRFTTDKLKTDRKRAVDVKIASVTAGIRGTDLWGKAAADKDVVCLIEGRISVEKEGTAPITMAQPLTFYVAPKQGNPSAVAPVPQEKLKEWASETEISAGQAVTTGQGRWLLQAAKVDSKAEAVAWYDNLRHAGYPAKIRSGKFKGKPVYRLMIGNLSDEAAANALAERLKTEFNLTNQVVSQGRL